ncbi:MAG: cardiolipin synthase B [Micrococcales bacterium]|nr:MAG: cardiolipin synthase B [Micrococcales bacterium]PIE27144.1 MAG: cardiolipin synthase B [Micrococcales bacterium]
MLQSADSVAPSLAAYRALTAPTHGHGSEIPHSKSYSIDVPRPSRSPLNAVRKLAIAGATTTIAAHVAVAGTIVGIDAVRRRRSTEAHEFPHAAPLTTTVNENLLTTYTYGVDLYEDMLASIHAARSHVFFESFIWKGDEYGQRFRDALARAADRGVAVYVIYDAFGNFVVDNDFYADIDPRVHLLRFPLWRWGTGLSLRRSGRDHRKILVVDDAVAYAGGFNVGSLYATGWRDTHTRIQGPAVWELADAFVDFWNTYRHSRHPVLHDVGSRTWDASVRAHRNVPGQLLFPVRALYMDAINRAQKRIYITQGYFIPDTDILHALLAARRRGVDVKVIIPERSNHILADWAARGYYATLLEAGITLWLYSGAMIHAKTACIDGQWTTIGSANIDRLSLTGNYEINLAVVSESLAGQMESIFEMDLSNCRQLTEQEWDRRGLLPRLSERFISSLRPML